MEIPYYMYPSKNNRTSVPPFEDIFVFLRLNSDYRQLWWETASIADKMWAYTRWHSRNGLRLLIDILDMHSEQLSDEMHVFCDEATAYLAFLDNIADANDLALCREFTTSRYPTVISHFFRSFDTVWGNCTAILADSIAWLIQSAAISKDARTTAAATAFSVFLAARELENASIDITTMIESEYPW